MGKRDHQIEAQVVIAWDRFRRDYQQLGYRRLSYEYFQRWLEKELPAARSYSADALRTMLVNHRKRNRG